MNRQSLITFFTHNFYCPILPPPKIAISSNPNPASTISVIPLLPMQKRILIATTLLLSAILITFILWRNINSTTAISHDIFALKSPEKITKITFSPNNTSLPYLTLEKVNEHWIVRSETQSFPADTHSIHELLFWAMPQLQVKCPVADASKETVTKDIALNGTKVIFSQENLEVHTLYVGYPTPTQDATYMYFPGTERPCEITVPGFVGYLTPYFNTNIQLWRSMFMIDAAISDIKSIKVTYPSQPQESFTISQDHDQIELKNTKNQVVSANQSLIAGYLELSKSLARYRAQPAGINNSTAAVKLITQSQPIAIFEYTFTSQAAKTITIYPMDITAGETYSMEEKDGKLKTKETNIYWAKESGDPLLWVMQDIVLHNRLKKLSDFIRPYTP
jgi:hypothetical protein